MGIRKYSYRDHPMRKFIILFLFTFGSVIPGNSNAHKAGIYQLTKFINGRHACYGVIIQLDKLSFKKTIAKDELSIIEAKYSRELKDILVRSVDKSQKILVIKIKAESGDFGSGDSINIRIKSAAFESEQNEDYVFSISTDPM